MRRWLPAAFIASAFALSAAVYRRLPERMPMHWNVRGEVDGWGGRLEGALLMPAVALGVWLLLVGLPRIDPRSENYEKFRPSYDLVVAAVVAFMCAMHGLVIAAALGHRVPMDRVVPVGVGALFVVIGNVLPRTRPNWWMGVRTPWTLSSDRVWARTHRVSGYLMVAAGLAIMLSALLPAAWSFTVLVAAAIGAGVGSVVFSYFAWRQERPR